MKRRKTIQEEGENNIACNGLNRVPYLKPLLGLDIAIGLRGGRARGGIPEYYDVTYFFACILLKPYSNPYRTPILPLKK